MNIGIRRRCPRRGRFVCALGGALALLANVVNADERAPSTAEASTAAAPSTAAPSTTAPSTAEPLRATDARPTQGPQAEDPDEPWRVPDWSAGDPVPAGYHPEQRHRLWPFLVGMPLAVLGYAEAVSLATTYPDLAGGSGWGYVPVVGPLVWVANLHGDDGLLIVLGDLVYASSTILQAAGIGLVTFGLASRQTVLVRNDTSRLRPIPVPMMLGMGAPGVGLAGAF